MRQRPALAPAALLIAAFATTAIGACADAPDPTPAAGFDLSLGALTAACGGPVRNPFQEIKTVKLVVREPTEGGGMTVLRTDTQPFKASQQTLTFEDVEAGSPREVTLLGYGTDPNTPAWFARKSGINIQKNKTIPLDLTLMAVEGFTCLAQPAEQIPHLVFPTATRIADGNVLITGGFAQATKSADGKDWELVMPSDLAYIFEPGTGKFYRTKSKAGALTIMKAARGAHSAIYLPGPNKVLIVGGAKKMYVAAAGTEPPRWKPADGTNISFELYDVETGEFTPGTGAEFAKKRVFPNLMPLSDDVVVSLGGAVWPTADFQTHGQCDLFSSAAGGFVDASGSLPLNGVRAGAAVAYMGPTAGGTSRYLIFGGNVLPDSGSAIGKVTERFLESVEQGVGQFYADYTTTAKSQFDEKTILMFPSLNRLEPGLNSEGKMAERFLSVGGVRYDPATSKWLPPSADETYIVSVREPGETEGKGRFEAMRAPGLKAGIYLHQANLVGPGHVLVSGGFSQFEGVPASFGMQAFDIMTGKYLPDTALPGAKDFVRRGGHTGLTLSNDCLLLFGGAETFSSLQENGTAASDIYCPKLLVPKG